MFLERKRYSMKNSMIWRSLFREIKGSLGRFLAILSIVALGVGLFSGLKITKADFIQAITRYYKDTSFYDYRVLGELGFTQSQADLLASAPDVLAAEGAHSVDMLYLEENGAQKTGKFHSITKQINKLVIVAGRMPEKEGECLADSQYYSASAIGKKITFSEENGEDDLDQFECREYRIVGIVKSPLYIQFERGNTSLGNGSIDAFFFLGEENFTADYFTEIYVKMKEDFVLYSDDYRDYLEAKEEALTSCLDQACELRFQELPQLIADAETTLEEKKAEAWEELEDAREKLKDAEKELEDAKIEIEDGKEKIQEGKEELESARKDLEDAEKTIIEKEAELEEGIEKLEKGKKELQENEKLLTEKEAELLQAKSAVTASEMTIQLGEMQQSLTMEGLISEQKTIDSSNEALEKRRKAADDLEETAKALGLEEYYKEQIRKEREEIAKQQAELDKQLKDLHIRYLDAVDTGRQIEAGKIELDDARSRIQEGEKSLQEGKEKLHQGKIDLIEAEKTIEDGKEQLRVGKNEIKQGKADLEEGEKTLAEKEAELNDGIQKYKDGLAEYDDGLAEYQDGLEEFNTEIAKAEDAIRKQREKLDKGEIPEGYLLGRNTNIGYVCFENDSSIVDGIANVFPVFFFLVAALVCITTMNRMVEEQRTQIGVLKALGYSDGTIMFKYMFYSGFAAVTGCLIGYFGGIHLFPFIIWTVYGIMYQAGPVVFTFNTGLFLLSLSVSLLCSVGTTYLSCGRELKGWAAQLMRPKAPKAGKRVFLEYVPFLWKRLSFLRKVAVRNIMRYKKRLFMMVLGIGGCTALLVTGFGIKDSIAGVGDMQYSEIQLFDLSLVLQKEPEKDFFAELEELRSNGMEDYLLFQETTQDLVVGDRQKTVTVVVLPKEIEDQKLLQFIDLHDKVGKHIMPPLAGQVVITDKLASTFQIHEGDMVSVRDGDMKEMKLKVSGIAENYIYDYIYLDQRSWEEQRKEAFCAKSLYLNAREGTDVHQLAAASMDLPGVVNIGVTRDMVMRFDKMMSSLNLIVVVVILCAAGLAFIVLYNLTNINITERIREIATIKVLGFYPGETALYVFRENMVLTFLGALAGLVMGKALHAFVMHEVKVDVVSFAVRVLPLSYLYSVILTFVFALGVNILMNGKLEKISMTESLKSVD